MFTLAHQVGSWDISGSLVSLACALGVDGFIRGRRVPSRLYGSLDSSGFVGFTLVRSRGLLVHSRSLGSLAFDLGVVEYILGHWGHFLAFYRLLGSFAILGSLICTM